MNLEKLVYKIKDDIYKSSKLTTKFIAVLVSRDTLNEIYKYLSDKASPLNYPVNLNGSIEYRGISFIPCGSIIQNCFVSMSNNGISFSYEMKADRLV